MKSYQSPAIALIALLGSICIIAAMGAGFFFISMKSATLPASIQEKSHYAIASSIHNQAKAVENPADTGIPHEMVGSSDISMEKPEAYPLEPEKQKSLWRYHNKLVQNPGRALKKHQRIATFMDAVEAEYQAESSILAKPLLSEKETKSALSKIIFKKREQKRDKHGPLYKLFVGKPLASYPYSTERENIDKVLEKLDYYAEFTAAYNHEDKQSLLERMTALRDKLLNISSFIGSCKEYYIEQSIQAPAQKFNFRGLLLTKWW